MRLWCNEPQGLNESTGAQSEIDFLTGRSTFIYGQQELSSAEWRGCSTLNRQRSNGIQAAARTDASGESDSLDAWHASFARTSIECEVPLVDMRRLGFHDDSPEIIGSNVLTSLGLGREATAWLHRGSNTVYKLFDLRNSGSLGWTLTVDLQMGYNAEVIHKPAILSQTLEKLCVLHEIGACPTEIVGISEDGRYLVIKQVRCFKYRNLEKDRWNALRDIHAVRPLGNYGMQIWVFWSHGESWFLTDLHEGNIRRLPNGSPTIIDALVCRIEEDWVQYFPHLPSAIFKAKALSFGQDPPEENFDKGYDAEL